MKFFVSSTFFLGILILCACQSKPGGPSGDSKTTPPEPPPIACETSLKGLALREVAQAAYLMMKKCQISEAQLVELAVE